MKQPLYFENPLKALEAGFASGLNVLLFGPPGHAKSDGALFFLQEMKKVGNVFVKSFSGGTTTEELYGGIDIARMKTDGAIHYRVTEPECFGVHEYCIFDEMFDAREKILASLKDTLMAREIRNGAQRMPLKTKMIIALTNVDADDFADNWERAAILERFPIRCLVKWEDYSPTAFTKLASHVLDKKYSGITKQFAEKAAEYVAQTYEQANTMPITPRTFIQAVQAVANTKKPEYGWIVLGNYDGNSVETPKELIFKWRIGNIRTTIGGAIKRGEFALAERQLTHLKLFLPNATEDQKGAIVEVIKEYGQMLYAHLCGEIITKEEEGTAKAETKTT